MTLAFLSGSVLGFLFGWSLAWAKVRRMLTKYRRDLELMGEYPITGPPPDRPRMTHI